MWQTGSGSVKILICVVFVADGHPSCRAEGVFVPVLEDDPASRSRVTGETIVRPLAFDQPPLSQSDYMVGDLVNTVPVGGPFEFVCGSLGKDYSRHLYNSVVPPGFSSFSSKLFSGGVAERHRTPQGSKGSFSHLQGDPRVDQKKRYRPSRRFSVTLPFSYFVIPKKTGDLRVILNLKEINVFIPVQHFRMETLNVILPDLRPQDWAVSLDLKDAYLHVPVHPQSRRLLVSGFSARRTCTRSCRSA